MSQAMDALPLGHPVDFKGAVGKFEYLGNGVCAINEVRRCVKRFIMVCAGSGITPIFQVLRAVMQNREDATQCLVFYGNRKEEDILCREEVDALLVGCEGKGRVLYSLTQPGESWSRHRGRVDGEMLIREGGTREEGSMVLVSGPPGMERSFDKALREQAWKDDEVVFF
jgi:nitrate reductase (NAD(P)H)